MSDEIGIVLSEKRYNELKRIESLFKELTKEISDKAKQEDPLIVTWGKDNFDEMSLNDQYEEIHQEIRRLTNEEGKIWAKLHVQQVRESCRRNEELRKKEEGKMFIPKDGDVVYNDRKKSTSIFKSQTEYGSTIYAGIDSDGHVFIDERGWSSPTRLANQKETFTFFDALKGKGVRWNAEKKKIEKLRWRAKQGEKYWIVQGTGDIEFTTEREDAADNTFYDYGNYHKTKEMATKARDEVSSLYKSINNSQL
jgi:hypothetical protein